MTSLRALATVASLSLLAGCTSPTWRRHAPGAGFGRDTVIVVGSIAGVTDPGRGGAGKVMAFFTDDLSEPLRPGVDRPPFDRFDWAWLPGEGHFFVEVPRRERIYLRGVQYDTQRDGAVRLELPAQVEIRDDDRVVYVGEVRVGGGSQRRLSFGDRTAEARKVAQAAGHTDVLAVPWRTRLLGPLDGAAGPAPR
jgi:hypothetical protein